MNILYVSSPLASNYGGGEKFIENLITNLKSDEHEFLGGSKALFDVFKKLGFKATLSSAGLEPVTMRNLLFSPLSAILGLVHLFKFRDKFIKADLIVSPTSFTELFFVLPWLKIFWNKPMVFIIQNNRFPKSISKSPLKPILKWMWKNSPVVFVSKTQQKEWQSGKLAHSLASNSCVIYHGIPIYNSVINNHSKRNEVHIGFLARIHQEKGLDTLIQALSGVETSLNLIIHIGGEGEYLSELKKLQLRLQIPANIIISWEGFVSPTLPFYDNLDLFVFPSRRESFGLVIAESWERGVPVLCSDLEVFKELKSLQINNKESSFFHKMDSVEDLKIKFEDFLNHLEYWKSHSTKLEIRQTVLENFQIENMTKSYRLLFQKETEPKAKRI